MCYDKMTLCGWHPPLYCTVRSPQLVILRRISRSHWCVSGKDLKALIIRSFLPTTLPSTSPQLTMSAQREFAKSSTKVRLFRSHVLFDFSQSPSFLADLSSRMDLIRSDPSVMEVSNRGASKSEHLYPRSLISCPFSFHSYGSWFFFLRRTPTSIRNGHSFGKGPRPRK